MPLARMHEPAAQSQHRKLLQTSKLPRRVCCLNSANGTAPQLSFLTFNVLADGLAQAGGFIKVGTV